MSLKSATREDGDYISEHDICNLDYIDLQVTRNILTWAFPFRQVEY